MKDQKEQKKRVCQNCKLYKRPCCYLNDKKFTARKNTCEWFRMRK